MKEQRVMTTSTGTTGKDDHVNRSTVGKAYMNFQCVRCKHSVSPGMFTAEGWAVYKQTGLCPDCQE